jgi:hypothetical protein
MASQHGGGKFAAPSTTKATTPTGADGLAARVQIAGGRRPLRPPTRRGIVAAADGETVYDGEGPGTRSPFISDEGRDVVENLGGRHRETSYAANAPNPPDPAAPCRNLRDR